MSNSSPFLQELTDNMTENGASEEEVNIVVNDLEALKEACSKKDGYVWNNETSTCDLKIDLEPIEKDVVIDPVGETDDKTEVKTEIEPVVEAEAPTSTSVDLINNNKKDPWERPIAESKKQQEKTAAMYPKEDLFRMNGADFGWGGDGYTEEAMVDLMLRKYGGLGLEIKVSGVGTSKFIIGGQEVPLADMWTSMWNPDFCEGLSPNECNEERANVVNEHVDLFLETITKENSANISCEQTPKNLYYLQEILQFFPNAKVINCKRNF